MLVFTPADHAAGLTHPAGMEVPGTDLGEGACRGRGPARVVTPAPHRACLTQPAGVPEPGTDLDEPLDPHRHLVAGLGAVVVHGSELEDQRFRSDVRRNEARRCGVGTVERDRRAADLRPRLAGEGSVRVCDRAGQEDSRSRVDGSVYAGVYNRRLVDGGRCVTDAGSQKGDEDEWHVPSERLRHHGRNILSVVRYPSGT